MLAIDCAGASVSVCAGFNSGDLISKSTAARLNHNELLARLVGDVLANGNLPTPTMIAVNVGPGSFTGTRVGVSLAIGLAQGWHVPVLPVTSFELLARLAPASVDRLAVAMPLVRNIWCRVFLSRRDVGWEEGVYEELAGPMQVNQGLDGRLLILSRGDLPTAIVPPANWDTAGEIWKIAKVIQNRASLDPEMVRVKYAGPSQAERNFRARQRETGHPRS